MEVYFPITIYGKPLSLAGCGKIRVSYQGSALAMPQPFSINLPFSRLPKNSFLHLILGGAAVYRCDNCFVLIPAVAADPALGLGRGIRLFSAAF
jgi:hypothetical protein